MFENLKIAFNISIIILCLVFVITSNGDSCISNDVILCNKYTSYAKCTIYQNNSEIISQAISLCSAGSFSWLYIYLDSGLLANTTIITLNLANNIQSITIYSYSNNFQPVYLIASQSNPYVTSMNLYYLSIYNSDYLFDNFPNITNIYVQFSNFNAGPKFSKLKELTRVNMYKYYFGSTNITMDKEWVGGLAKLQYLRLHQCGIKYITTDAFENLNSLTYLDLGGNYLHIELAPEIFRDLTALKQLHIAWTWYIIKIPLDSKNNNAFSPLKQLTYLYLTYTKIIPFDAFSTISSIERLYLPIASSGIVSSTPLQHLRKLTYLKFTYTYYTFGGYLVCNCSMQWVSIIGKFGIYIESSTAVCDSGGYADDSSLYTECGLTESYQCFNKSVSCNHTCINTPDSYICACDAGYGLSLTEAESACHDIDECLLNTSQCEQKCRNTLGSYQCYCDSGYRLSTDFISCTDIDECNMSSWNKCEQHQCMNEIGSYRCTCNPGYKLAGDGHSCYDLNECSNSSLNTCNQHTCINELGSYTCCCRQGYQLTTNDKICQDVDECSLDELNSCGSHKCVNEQGSYRCICYDGYELAVNNISCHDIDECMDANNSCNPHKCLNLVGSYTCSCGEGYNLTTNKTSCTDIDECSLVSENSCGSHQCVNEQGSYRCVCDEGFKLAANKISCHDIDECMDANNSCNPHVCLNLVDSYTCSCGEGFNLTTNGKNCEEVDKCNTMITDKYKQHLCINEDGVITIYTNDTCNTDFVNFSSCLPLTATTHISLSTLNSISPSNQCSGNLASNTSEISADSLIGIVIFLIVIIIGLCIFLFSLLLIFLYKKKNKEKDCPKVQENSNSVQEKQSEYIEMAPNLDYPVQNKNQQDSKTRYQEMSINSIPKSKISLTKQPKGDYTTSYENLADLPNISNYNAEFDYDDKDSNVLYENLSS